MEIICMFVLNLKNRGKSISEYSQKYNHNAIFADKIDCWCYDQWDFAVKMRGEKYYDSYGRYKIPEEAELGCLRNLIEIVKNRKLISK